MTQKSVFASTAVVRRHFLVLHGLRWLSTGLIIPVVVLVMLDRGLTLGQIGLVTAAQGVAVLLLELPTGGLADIVGRRNVLLLGWVFSFASMALFAVAQALWVFAVAWALQGVYRALESGPLASWYVDTAQALDPEVDIETDMARAATVLGGAIGVGTLLAGGLVAWDPFPDIDALVVPVIASLGVMVVELLALLRLMTEPARSSRLSMGVIVADVPATIETAVRTVRGNRALIALVGIEVLWGFGMIAFEMFTPAKLEAVLDSADQAATWMGPMNSVGWLAGSAAAAVVPLVTHRIGHGRAGTLYLLLLGILVVGIGVAAGPEGVVVAYVLAMSMHMSANAVHEGLLHRSVDDPDVRATVVSINSLCAGTGGMVGGIVLGALADATTLTTAVIAGAACIAAAAPAYLVATHNSASNPY